MGRLPGFAVIRLPLAFEPFRIAAANPEFRFFQMNCLRPRIERALNSDAKELSVIGSGTHVVHIPAVADSVSVTIGLGLVFVVDAIEPAVKIILILSPGNTGHDVNAVTAITPTLHSGGQIGSDTVGNTSMSASGLRGGTMEAAYVGGGRPQARGGIR